MSETIQIESHVPMPERSKLPDFPLSDMNTGDSFVLEIKNPSQLGTIRQRVVRYQKANPLTKWSVIRESETQVRVFRIEDNQ